MAGGGHVIDDEQEGQDERANEEEFEGAPDSKWFCVHSPTVPRIGEYFYYKAKGQL